MMQYKPAQIHELHVSKYEGNNMYLVKRSFQILVVFLAVPVSVYADSWSCSNDNLVREVHIGRTTSASVPCNVVYRKQTEGVEDQVLWNAENDEAYCIEQAKGLVATLESNGWVCAETISDDNINNGTDGNTATGNDEDKKPEEESTGSGSDS